MLFYSRGSGMIKYVIVQGPSLIEYKITKSRKPLCKLTVEFVYADLLKYILYFATSKRISIIYNFLFEAIVSSLLAQYLISHDDLCQVFGRGCRGVKLIAFFIWLTNFLMILYCTRWWFIKERFHLKICLIHALRTEPALYSDRYCCIECFRANWTCA